MMKLLILLMLTRQILSFAIKAPIFPIVVKPLPQLSLCKLRCSTQNSGSIDIGNTNEKVCSTDGQTYMSECHADCDNAVINSLVLQN